MVPTLLNIVMILLFIRVHFPSQKITITFLILTEFQNFKDRQACDACVLLLVLFLKCYDARVRI